MLRTYRYRLYPNKTQREHIRKNTDACRFVYNWALETKMRVYEQDGKNLSWYDLNNLLIELKQDHPFLKHVYSQSLQQAIKRLHLVSNISFSASILVEKGTDIPNSRVKNNTDSPLISHSSLLSTLIPEECDYQRLAR